MSTQLADPAPPASDDFTIEDAKQFIADSKKKKEHWQITAERSWQEIKKRNKRGKLLTSGQDFSSRKGVRFPLWWTCLMIRQPIVLARLPLPIARDTKGEDDEYGRTACLIYERLLNSILKTFDAMSVFSCARDDFLITNFGWTRAFYERDVVEEPEHLPVQMIPPMPGPNGEPPPPDAQPVFVGPDGQPVQNPKQDDEGGYYIETGRTIQVADERVYLADCLYTDFFPDPDARRWAAVKRLAFAYDYSYRDFKAKFGQDALNKLVRADVEEHRSGKPITVYEYWDAYTKTVHWFAENSEDFFQPAGMAQVPDHTPGNELQAVATDPKEKSAPDHSDIYGLDKLFPCPEPLIVNAPTDEFWPVPEFYQVQDVIDDVHQIVTRMFLLTKAIRVRFLYDASVPELKALIGETGEGGGLAVPNLAQALLTGQAGSLASLVAYFPVKEMIEGLSNMNEAFQGRLNMFFQLTGLNELLRGQTSNDVEKTFGERQMEGKYAMNRMEPFQRGMQEFIKRGYELLGEMALKNFSDDTIEDYINPQSLEPVHQQRYSASLELLKENRRARFRLDFETDSTIAINEQYRRQEATDLANVLTKAMESTAKIAETQPELAVTELAVLKHLVGQFTEGKLFIDDIVKSIEDVMEKMKQPDQKPDPEMMKVQLEQAKAQGDQTKLVLDDKFRNLQLQLSTQLEYAKLNQTEQLNNIKTQLEVMKQQADQGAKASELQQSFEKLQADIGIQKEQIEVQREAVMVKLQELTDKKEIAQLQQVFDARMAEYDRQIAVAQQQLDVTRVAMEAREKATIDQRMQDGHQLEAIRLAIDHHHETQNRLLETATTLSAAKAAEPAAPAKQPEIKVNVQMPKQKSKKRIIEPVKDKKGNLKHYSVTDIVDGTE